MANKFHIPAPFRPRQLENALQLPDAAARKTYANPAANLRVLTVGAENPADGPVPTGYFQNQGFKTDYRTISEAMDAIPLEKNIDDHHFMDRWVILVTPGSYMEEIRMKPFVNVVGLGHHNVFVHPPPPRDRTFDSSGKRALVYLNHFSAIQNIVLGKRVDSSENDYAIWNKDVYAVERREGVGKRDPSDFGAFDVPIFPFVGGGEGPRGELNKGKSILMEGKFSTAFMVGVGASYNGTHGFDFEIIGEGQNADCHIVDCFFDALFLHEGELMASNNGGCLHVDNCIEVHVRNSLLRVGPDRDAAWTVPKTIEPSTHGAAIRATNGAHVLVEGSSLFSPGARSDRVLDAHDGAQVGIFHSTVDSIRGARNVYEKRLARHRNGVIKDGPAYIFYGS